MPLYPDIRGALTGYWSNFSFIQLYSFFTTKSVTTYELQGVPLTFFTFRVLITLKIYIIDLMMVKPVWEVYINFENCKQTAENFEMNIRLSNTLWHYQNGVKSASFLSYKQLKSQKCKWNTLYFLDKANSCHLQTIIW